MAHALVVIGKTGIRSASGTGLTLPALYRPDAATAKRVHEFFTANIRNPNTRKAYAKAAGDFAAWCEQRGLDHLRHVQPIHVAAYIEELQQRIAAPSVKVQLAAIRMLFDWLVLGQVVPTNPAIVVRGPKYVVKKDKTPIHSADYVGIYFFLLPASEFSRFQSIQIFSHPMTAAGEFKVSSLRAGGFPLKRLNASRRERNPTLDLTRYSEKGSRSLRPNELPLRHPPD